MMSRFPPVSLMINTGLYPVRLVTFAAGSPQYWRQYKARGINRSSPRAPNLMQVHRHHPCQRIFISKRSCYTSTPTTIRASCSWINSHYSIVRPLA